MKSRSLVIAASAALVLAGVAVAAPAEAVTCSSGRACLWKDTNYLTAGSATNSKSFSQYLEDYTGYSWTGQGGINDNATSVYNNGTSESTRWYRDTFGFGGFFTVATSSGDANLANSTGVGGTGHNDWVSSSYFSSYYPS